MKVFIENPELLINEFNKLVAISQNKAFITVGIEIQKEEIETLKNYRNDLLKLKKEFVERNLENEANLVYCIENSIKTIQYELEMLVNLKSDNMNEAWGNLVNAQITFGTVVRNYPFETNFLNAYIERLTNYEKLLFPNLFFHSVGGFIKSSHCSICNENYRKCEHIKGKLYKGELCCQVITEMELEEVSLVKNPANKHCRVLTIERNGKTLDIMTLRESSTTANEHAASMRGMVGK